MDFFTAIAQFLLNIPPWKVIYPNEKGVLLRGGKFKGRLGPGFFWKWPIYDAIQKLDVTTQVINLPNQSITTTDNHSIATSGAIEYQIVDAKRAILCIQDFDASLQNLALGTISHYLSKKTYADCMDIGGLETEVLRALRKRVVDWGLSVAKFWITDLAEHKVYRIMTHETPQPLILEKE